MQVEITTRGKLDHKLLESNGVYIIDCLGEVFIWMGKQSTRLVRAAALKLAHELCAVIQRPSFAPVTRISEGSNLSFQNKQFFRFDLNDYYRIDFGFFFRFLE